MVKMVKKPARDKLQASMKELVANVVKVGYFADQGMHPHAKMSYPSLMFLQEVVGIRTRSGKVHRRVFELTAMTDGKRVRQSTMLTLKRNLIRGGNMKIVQEHFGEKMRDAIKDNFGKITGLTPANAPATIARKGNNLPLIETSDLKDKLTYRITKKGSQ